MMDLYTTLYFPQFIQMDPYLPTLVALAAIYIVFEITKYMATLCVCRNHLKDIAATLGEMNKKLQAMPFEAVCLCEVCAPPALPQAASRRPSVAAILQATAAPAPPEKIEHVAIGILDSDDEAK
jgi:hypothetical protein